MIDPKNFISYSVWLGLPFETRYKIAELFGIRPAGIRETIYGHGGGQVVSDGFLHKDLAVITKEKMSEITGVESDDFYELFNALVSKVEGKSNNFENDVQPKKQEEVSAGGESTPKKARGRAKKTR